MKRTALWVLAFIMTGFIAPATAQNILSFDVPTEMCPDEMDTVRFGINSSNNIQVNEIHTALGHSETIFLPDGEECNGSCSYISPVTFEGFDPGTKIRNVNDIKYVRLNMEHSFIGDIFIRITCPTNKRATLMRFGGSNTSSCYGNIPNNERGWLTGSNVYGGTYFGSPVDAEDSYYPCDATRFGNRPGVGWNYCWSNNTNSGYQYASGDGIIYRSGHSTNGYSIDSSNVRLGRKFYHPDQSFQSLVGCPVNGTWQIEVVDGYGVDNGYIFEWELVLSPTLAPIISCGPESYDVIGPNVQQINDSVFTIASSPDIYHDTVIDYTYRVITNCGDTIDSVGPLHIYPKYDIVVDTLVCDGEPDTIVQHLSSIHGCDSTVTTNIGVLYSSETTISRQTLENDLPFGMMGINFYGPTDTTFMTENVSGCDSAIHFHLDVYYNHSVDTLRREVCDNQLPYSWGWLVFEKADTIPITLNDMHGADSSVVYVLAVKPTYDTTLKDTTCANIPYDIGGYTFADSGYYTIPLVATNGCDSIVYLDLALYPPIETFVRDTVCENIPYEIAGHTFADVGEYTIPLVSASGCDSIVHLDLSHYPIYEKYIYDSACHGTGVEFYDEILFNSGTYVHNFSTVDGCDSSIYLHLVAYAEGLEAVIQANPSIVTVDNREYKLYNASHHSAYGIWTINGNTYTERQLDMRYPLEEDSIPVLLVAYSPEGCTDTARTNITIDRAHITTPNVFTPTQETNNLWCVATYEIISTELWIYPRSGNLVKHISPDEPPCWDGTIDGRACQQGTYVYTLLYTTDKFPDRVQKQLGTILLLR